MTPGVPKFRKESHPERAMDNEHRFLSHLLSDGDVQSFMELDLLRPRFSDKCGVEAGKNVHYSITNLIDGERR